MKISRTVILILLGLTVILAMTGTVSAQEVKKILIGGNTALSGPAAPWGHAMSKVWEMAIGHINGSGGINVKGQKYEYELKVYDHAMDAGKAVANANRLITRDDAKYIFTLDIAMVKAYQPISEKAKVISVATATPHKSAINKDCYYTWMYGLDAWAGALLYPWLEENTNIKRVAILQPDTLTGEASAQGSRFGIEHTKSLEVVFEEFAPETTEDFYPILNRLLKTNPDIIDCNNWDPAVVALLVKQARELGYKGPMYIITPDIANMKAVAGWEACEGLYLLPYSVEGTPLMRQVKKEFIEKYGEKNWIGALAYAFYDFPGFFKEAMEGAQSTDTTEVCKWLERNTVKSIYGEPAFFGGVPSFGIARIPIAPYSFARIEKGEIVQVATDLYAWSLVSKEKQEAFKKLIKK